LHFSDFQPVIKLNTATPWQANRAGQLSLNTSHRIKQVAEKLMVLGDLQENHLSGVKTPTHFIDLIGTDKSVPYKETHDLTLLDALRPFHPLRVGEAGGALLKQRHWLSFQQPVKPGVKRRWLATRVNSCPDTKLRSKRFFCKPCQFNSRTNQGIAILPGHCPGHILCFYAAWSFFLRFRCDHTNHTAANMMASSTTRWKR